MSPRKAAVGGGLGTIILLLIVMFLGGDPRMLLNQRQQQGGGGLGGGPGAAAPQRQGPIDPAEEELADMVGVVLADTEDVWNALFRRAGGDYEEPTLVLFSGNVQSACGFADAAMGPFYCPGDRKVYIDLSFFDELRRKFGAPGDFAQAYVVAHEVGHHVQKLMGYSDLVHRQRNRVGESEYNRLSVRLELQADYLAGVWAHHAQRAKNILERGDVDEAIRAATAIGDDRLQKQSQGYVVPDSFTHGTSEQRVRWFAAGIETGDFSQDAREQLFTLPYEEL